MTTARSSHRNYMQAVAAHAALAIIWIVLTGVSTPANFLVGLAIASVVLWLLPPAEDHAGVLWPHGYLRKIGQMVRFAAFFAYELLQANLRMAADILRPSLRVRPAIIAVPLDLETDAEITLLANMITLTPGTLSLDVSPDRRTLYVHAVHTGGDPDAVRQSIKGAFERRVKEVMR